MAEPKDLVAWCGLYCGDCFGYQGRLADLARDLRKELRRARFDRTAEFMATIPLFKVFESYGQCYEVLGALVKLRCKKACRGGGGPPRCRIRSCCQKNGFEGCWECAAFARCEKLTTLEPVHGDAHLKNLRKLKREGVEEFLAGKRHWYSKKRASG